MEEDEIRGGREDIVKSIWVGREGGAGWPMPTKFEGGGRSRGGNGWGVIRNKALSLGEVPVTGEGEGGSPV